MTKPLSNPDYPAFLAGLKQRILEARTSAARAVNRDLVLLYWDIGRGIVEKQKTAGWGAAVVERLAIDLRAEFPDLRGFSADNLWRMRQFFTEYSAREFLEQAVPELNKRQRKALEQPVPETNPPDLAEANGDEIVSQIRSIHGLGTPAKKAQILAEAVRELIAAVP